MVLSTRSREEDGDSSAVPSERTRGSRHRLKYRKFPLSLRENKPQNPNPKATPFVFYWEGDQEREWAAQTGCGGSIFKGA